MTICVAAICESGRAIVVAADRTLTAHLVSDESYDSISRLSGLIRDDQVTKRFGRPIPSRSESPVPPSEDQLAQAASDSV
jgi:hypothetical protein